MSPDASAFRAELRSLGPGNLQASPGDHIHDGSTSKRLATSYIVLSKSGSTGQSIGSGTEAKVSFGTVKTSLGDWSKDSPASGDLWVPETGWYAISATVQWDDILADGLVQAYFVPSWTEVYTHHFSGEICTSQINGYHFFTEGDAAYLKVFNWLGSAINVIATDRTYMSMIKVQL